MVRSDIPLFTPHCLFSGLKIINETLSVKFACGAAGLGLTMSKDLLLFDLRHNGSLELNLLPVLRSSG